MVVYNNVLAGASGSGSTNYEIERSLRFENTANSHLKRTPSSAGNRRTFTWSGWVKRTNLGAQYDFFAAGNASDYLRCGGFNADDKLEIRSDSAVVHVKTTRRFRDTSAWYHIVIAIDTTQATNTNRVKIYVNGVQETDFESTTYPSQNREEPVNDTGEHRVGAFIDKTSATVYYPFSGYLAEVHFVDGQQLDPTHFGEFDATTGIWNPIEYTNTTTTGLTITAAPTLSNGALIIKGVNNNTLQGLATSEGGGLNFWTSVDGINWSHSGSGQGPNSIGGSTVKYVAMGGAGTALRTWRSSGPNFEYALWNTDTTFDSNTGNPGNVTGLTYTAGPSSNYGHTGFHLDFKPTGGQIFSSGTLTGSIIASNPITNAFDGKTSTGTWAGTSAGFELTFPTALTVANSITVVGGSSQTNYKVIVGGTEHAITFPNGSSSYTQEVTISVSGSFTGIKGTNNSGEIRGIKVDGGPLLVDHEAPGVDASGSRNHWKVVNLLPVAGTYLNDFTGTERSGFSWSQAFDGNLESGSVPNAGSSWTFTPSIPIPFSTLAVYGYKDTSPGTLKINGTDVTSQIPNHNQIGSNQRTVISGISSPITSIQNISNGGLANIVFAGLEIDGGLLLDRASEVDVLIDSPTNYEADSGNNGGNYCVLNDLAKSPNLTLTNGALEASSNNNQHHAVLGTFALNSGKWYFEMQLKDDPAAPDIGWHEADYTTAQLQNFNGTSRPGSYCVSTDGNNNNVRTHNNSTTTTVSATSWARGDIIACAIDMDAKKIWFRKNNNAWYPATNGGTSGDPATGANPSITYTHTGLLTPRTSCYSNNYRPIINFGSRNFTYTPPTGYLSLCTQNLDDPLIAKSSNYFNVVKYTGNGGSQTISGLEFEGDLFWLKSRSAAHDHWLFDSVRGLTEAMYSNANSAEYDYSPNGITATSNTGFTLTSSGQTFNNNNVNFVGWIWDAGSSTVSNTDGDVTSTVRANPTAGFSIVKWTNNGNNTPSSHRWGHGLGVTPDLVITKRTNTTGDWNVYSEVFDNPVREEIYLNTTAAKHTAGVDLYHRDSTTVGIRAGSIGSSGDTHIAYCFSAVNSFSSFGIYQGNGSANGPFINTSMRPAFLLVKSTTLAQPWYIFDVARNTFNSLTYYLKANSSDQEGSASQPAYYQFMSNGFQVTDTNVAFNQSGQSYLYITFAENPFKFARAR